MTETLFPAGVLANNKLACYYSDCKTELQLRQKFLNEKSILYVNFFWFTIHAARDEEWINNNHFLAGAIYHISNEKMSEIQEIIKEVSKAIQIIGKKALEPANPDPSETITLRKILKNSKSLKKNRDLKKCTVEELPAFFRNEMTLNLLYDFMLTIRKNSDWIATNCFRVGQLTELTNDRVKKNEHLITTVKSACERIFEITSTPHVRVKSTSQKIFFDLISQARQHEKWDFLFRILSKLGLPSSLTQDILCWNKDESLLFEKLEKNSASYIVLIDNHQKKLSKMNKELNEALILAKPITKSTPLLVDSNAHKQLKELYSEYERQDYYLWDKLIDHVGNLRATNRWDKLMKQLANLPVSPGFKKYFISKEFDTGLLHNLSQNNILDQKNESNNYVTIRGAFEAEREEMEIPNKFHLYQYCSNLLQASPSSSYSSSPPSSASNISE